MFFIVCHYIHTHIFIYINIYIYIIIIININIYIYIIIIGILWYAWYFLVFFCIKSIKFTVRSIAFGQGYAAFSLCLTVLCSFFLIDAL